MDDNGTQLRNWAGNVVFAPTLLHRPTSVGQLQEIVSTARRIRALGTRHSFSTVADGPSELVTVAHLPPVIDVDASGGTARVSAGMRWGEIAPELHAAGLAMHTLGSLPHISVAGSVATGTHGSGDSNGCLATAVREIEFVTAAGDLRRISRGDADFDGSVVALGSLGVLTHLTLDLLPAYDVRQVVYDGLAWDVALTHLDDIMSAGSSVSLFTTWAGRGFEQVWVKTRTDEPQPDLRWTGAVAADGPRHPVPGVSPEHCTQQGGVPGPWFDRVPHFRLEFTPSSGEELQTEYLVPRSMGADALRAVESVHHLVSPVLQISEIRSIAGDDLWLSPAYGRASLAIHFTWIADTEAVLPVVREVERVLAPYGARPHWGKVFAMDPAVVAGRYVRRADFADLRRRCDPTDKFRNDFVDAYVLGMS